MSTNDEGFAGLPQPGPKDSSVDRPCWRYKIPEKLLSRSWSRDKGDAVFYMIEMTPDEQDRAVRAAGGVGEKNSAAASHQMIVRSIYRIGDQKVVRKEDAINAWIKEIGPKAYRCVQAAWVDLHSAEDRDLDNFLESAEYVD